MKQSNSYSCVIDGADLATVNVFEVSFAMCVCVW